MAAAQGRLAPQIPGWSLPWVSSSPLVTNRISRPRFRRAARTPTKKGAKGSFTTALPASGTPLNGYGACQGHTPVLMVHITSSIYSLPRTGIPATCKSGRSDCSSAAYVNTAIPAELRVKRSRLQDSGGTSASAPMVPALTRFPTLRRAARQTARRPPTRPCTTPKERAVLARLERRHRDTSGRSARCPVRSFPASRRSGRPRHKVRAPICMLLCWSACTVASMVSGSRSAVRCVKPAYDWLCPCHACGMAAGAVEIFKRHRARSFGLAYRMLGSAAGAEDIVQEAFLRWHNTEPGSVEVPSAWLAKVAMSRCLNRLDSAHSRREPYIGSWLPSRC